ncbi:MAG TPA: hypothetical protein VF996_02435 [Candidatus Saccharimonadales bacterium]|jgi:hypothetical protein
MREEKQLTFKLQNAPIIVGLSAFTANSTVKLNWPSEINYAELELNKKLLADVKEKLEWVKRQYQVLLKNPKTSAFAPHVAPYLTQANLHISADGNAFASEVAVLGGYPLEYTINLAKSLSSAVGSHVKPVQVTKVKESGKPAIEDRSRFRIIKIEPINELEAGFESYYGSSGLSYAAAYESWLDLSYEDKQKQLVSAISSRQAGVSYLMEVILEPQLLMDGKISGFFDIRAIQPPSPVHGYSLPKNLADGGMTEKCFDISYELYSELSTKYSSAAPLVCLWGHRQRALVGVNLSGLKCMASAKIGRLRRLAQVLLDKLAEKHPLIIEEVRATVNKL